VSRARDEFVHGGGLDLAYSLSRQSDELANLFERSPAAGRDIERARFPQRDRVT
jgi:hypothetical protein